MRAIEVIEKSIKTHKDWLAYFEKNPDSLLRKEYENIGDIEHHRLCIREYENAIAEIKQIQALALLKQQPIEGELTKYIRDNYNENGACGKTIYKLCDHLDSAEARLKELLEALEEAADDFYYIHKHPENAHTDNYKFMEKVNQAKKEGK